jgi:hypothetical protein
LHAKQFGPLAGAPVADEVAVEVEEDGQPPLPDEDTVVTMEAFETMLLQALPLPASDGAFRELIARSRAEAASHALPSVADVSPTPSGRA